MLNTPNILFLGMRNTRNLARKILMIHNFLKCQRIPLPLLFQSPSSVGVITHGHSTSSQAQQALTIGPASWSQWVVESVTPKARLPGLDSKLHHMRVK